VLTLWFYLATTLLASALFASAVAAGGAGLAAFVACSLLGSFDRIGRYSPGGLQSAAAALVRGTEPTGLLPPVLATTLLIALCIFATDRVCKRQEL
jgi:hypothetical protein